MAGLPWVRLDSNLATHDKVLALLEDPSVSKAIRFQSLWSYTCSMGYAGGHGTDGLIPFGALPYIHGARRTAELLVKHALWAPHPMGWALPTWDARQQSSDVTTARRAAQSRGAQKANCLRWHGPDCKCWEAA